MTWPWSRLLPRSHFSSHLFPHPTVFWIHYFSKSDVFVWGGAWLLTNFKCCSLALVLLLQWYYYVHPSVTNVITWALLSQIQPLVRRWPESQVQTLSGRSRTGPALSQVAGLASQLWSAPGKWGVWKWSEKQIHGMWWKDCRGEMWMNGLKLMRDGWMDR